MTNFLINIHFWKLTAKILFQFSEARKVPESKICQVKNNILKKFSIFFKENIIAIRAAVGAGAGTVTRVLIN